MAVLGEGPGPPTPTPPLTCILDNKKEMTEVRKTSRARKLNPPPPPLSSRSGSATGNAVVVSGL